MQNLNNKLKDMDDWIQKVVLSRYKTDTPLMTVDDAMQLARIAVFKELKKGGEYKKAYMIRAIEWAITNEARKTQNKPQVYIDSWVFENGQTQNIAKMSHEPPLYDGEKQAMVSKLVDTLQSFSERDQKIFYLIVLKGAKQRDVARLVNLDPSRVHRIAARVKKAVLN